MNADPQPGSARFFLSPFFSSWIIEFRKNDFNLLKNNTFYKILYSFIFTSQHRNWFIYILRLHGNQMPAGPTRRLVHCGGLGQKTI